MRTERICALARYVIADTINPAITAGTQWFERTLDDSANRRISISEAFMAIDAILGIYINVTSGLVVYPKVVESRIMKELPFIASENIMMGLVKKGGDRQEIHEKIRVHSIAAGKRVKEEGLENDMIERICNDPTLDITLEEIKEILVPSKYIGRCVEQVENFLANDVDPLLAGVDGIKVDLAV
jgi:adenylosuccinate lyase